jgi:hypothetical protein
MAVGFGFTDGKSNWLRGSRSGSKCGVAMAEVSTVDGTGPVLVSVVSESNDGDKENAVGNGSDGDDGGDDRGDDSVDEGVKVTKIFSVCGRDAWLSEIPDDARPSESVGSVSRSMGSWI